MMLFPDVRTKRGFTVIELLIVVAVLAVLAVIMAMLFNPAELIRKSRDSQRIADLTAIKAALVLYGNTTSSLLCPQTGRVWYSYPTSSKIITADLGLTDGRGWVPVNLSGLFTGSPLSVFPVDPLNSLINPASPADNDLVYRFACDAKTQKFELDAQLESEAYTKENDLRKNDGGNNDNLYEIGTDLNLLGSGRDF